MKRCTIYGQTITITYNGIGWTITCNGNTTYKSTSPSIYELRSLAYKAKLYRK